MDWSADLTLEVGAKRVVGYMVIGHDEDKFNKMT